jgi:heme/copper-type cytochrome/quinol oxidase subunit 2
LFRARNSKLKRLVRYQLEKVAPSRCLVYFFFIEKIIVNKKSIVSYIFTFYSFIRYVLLPVFIAITGHNQANYFLTNDIASIQRASLLMIYELIVLGVFIFIFSKALPKFRRRKVQYNVHIKGRLFIYVVLTMIAVLLLVVTPEIRSNLSFLIIQTEQGNRIEENIGTNLMLIRQIILTAFAMLYVVLVSISHRKFQRTGKKKYLFMVMLFTFLNIAIIVGERRIMQVYTAFASGYIVIMLFPKYKKRITQIILFLTIFVVGMMSIYKFFDAFLYNNYIDALMNSDFNIRNFARLLQSYFFGPQNVAVSLEITNSSFQPFSRLMFDFARSTMGLNFLVKDLMYTTNDIFNIFIYGNYVPSGHPVSGIGYGFMYLGYILSPLFSIIVIAVSIFVEKLLINTNSLEMKYMWSYILIRVSTPFAAFPSKVNVASLILISWGTVYLMAHITKLMTSRAVKIESNVLKENKYRIKEI